MTWIIYIPVGITIGIMFSAAYPESSQAINDALLPTFLAIGEKIKEIVVDLIRENV